MMVSLSPGSEIARSVAEARSALGALAKSGRLAYPLMGLAPLIDRSTVKTTAEAGDSAFELNEDSGEILFRESVVDRIVSMSAELANEVGLEGDEAIRLTQNAINLLVLHELEHVHQNFPHFAHVQEVKAGLPSFGLPLLDVAADTVAAWAAANIEAQRLGIEDEAGILRQFVNMLILAYMVGAFVFDVRGRPEKMQRVLGLLTAAVLIQAKVDGRLEEKFVYEEWTPLSPLLAMNLASSNTFNFLVIDKVPGLLLSTPKAEGRRTLTDIWDSIGVPPLQYTLELVALALRSAGAIRMSAANEDEVVIDEGSEQARADLKPR